VRGRILHPRFGRSMVPIAKGGARKSAGLPVADLDNRGVGWFRIGHFTGVSLTEKASG
jgi:hypothetical protein